MAQYPVHNFYIYDGEIKPNNEFIVSENKGGVYEVIRVAKGVPLFLEEHLERFCNSARLANLQIPFSRSEIGRFLSQLISRNGVGEGNILLSCKNKLKAFFIPHKYPDENWFTAGVQSGILYAERENPNAKVFQTTVRQMADELMEKGGYYEVLLVDHKGRITEGSRSNLFFVQGDKLITPPAKEVLLGITRQKTIMLAKALNIQVAEHEINLDNVHMYDAAFITGTSPKILPLKSINEWPFDPQNNVVQKLTQAYNDLMNNYIESYRLPE